MQSIPFALSIHKFINSVGADVGFASLIAVAILVLLYFAHGRETAMLRNRLDEAQTRIAGLESRITQLLQSAAAAQRGGASGGVAPAPGPPATVAPGRMAPARPPGMPSAERAAASAIPSVRRLPNPATAAASAATDAAASAATAPPMATDSGIPAAPAGVAAPALASATKLIPDGGSVINGEAPDHTVFVPAAVAAASSNGQHKSEATSAMPAVAVASAAGAASRVATEASRRAAGDAAPPRDATPPPVQIGAERRSQASRARRGSPGQRPETVAGAMPSFSDGGRRSGRMAPLVIAVAAVVVIIVGLVVITSTGGSTTANVTHGSGSNQTGASVSQHRHSAPPFKPSKVTVAVLNGTAVSGLAGAVGAKLTGDGFKKGNTTNASSQTNATTFVYYMPDATASANKTGAQHVAKALGLLPTRVRPATQEAIQSCSVSAAGASLRSCAADVIVLVGSDRASLASGASSG